ncbi:MAG TPA: DUF4142 domain-containing protein [Bryobacteraceae bacterium]|jgi:putative membrane protein|nr:DUF4142 domain-containing protein [Bryobacteraceae bacterium]
MLKTTIISMLSVAGFAALSLTAQNTVTANDAEFLRTAAQADMTAANLGQTAQDRAANPQVKDFGKQLATDHTKDYEQLCELAAKTGQSIPKAIDSRDDREIASLDRAKGKTFDHKFLVHETSEHEKLIHAFKQEAEHGTNPDVKAYANTALPVLESHLHHAQDLEKSKS